MDKKTLTLITFLLLVAAFLGGSTAAKIRYGGGKEGQAGEEAKGTPTAALAPTQPPFTPQKSAKPEIKFFVMSFCPYGNVAEAGLEPVYQLLKDKVNWQPRYIFSEISQNTVDQCKSYCPSKVANDEAKTQCQQAIDEGQLKGVDVITCVKQYFPYQTANECIEKECDSLIVGNLESMHGSQELNQDIREVIAYNLAVELGSSVLGAKSGEGILSKWWKFISLVNEKCTFSNADTCWKEQAVAAGLDTAKISQVEKTQKAVLAKKEIAEAQKYQATSSPTVLINDTIYNGGRSPEDYKKAICSAFENPPEECGKILGQESATTSGECQ